MIKPIDPVRLTQDLVRCRSVTPQDEGALDIVTENLSSMGFTVHPLRFEEEGTDPVDNIFARLGTEGPHLSFLDIPMWFLLGQWKIGSFLPLTPSLKTGFFMVGAAQI